MADQRPDQKPNTNKPNTSKPAIKLSLDGWAVTVALLLAALVRLGIVKHVAW